MNLPQIIHWRPNVNNLIHKKLEKLVQEQSKAYFLGSSNFSGLRCLLEASKHFHLREASRVSFSCKTLQLKLSQEASLR